MTYYAQSQLERPRRVIGLYSGMPVDGIDASAVEIAGAGDEIAPRLVAYLSVPYDDALRGAIREAVQPNRGSAWTMTILHAALGLAFADAAVRVRAAAGWGRRDVDVIGSHGHSIWRQTTPVELAGAFVTGAILLGDPAAIAEETGAPVVSDFAAGDMAAGGQGAPLLTMVDWLLYRHPTKSRALLNISETGTVTWLPAAGGADDVIVLSLQSGAPMTEGEEALTAECISTALHRALPSMPDEAIVRGAAVNPALTRLLGESLSVPVVTQEDLGWNGDAGESVAFAVLADRTMQGLPGNVPSVTGASHGVVLGNVTPGR